MPQWGANRNPWVGCQMGPSLMPRLSLISKPGVRKSPSEISSQQLDIDENSQQTQMDSIEQLVRFWPNQSVSPHLLLFYPQTVGCVRLLLVFSQTVGQCCILLLRGKYCQLSSFKNSLADCAMNSFAASFKSSKSRLDTEQNM